MFLGLESIKGDVYFCALIDLHHKLDEEGTLCELAEIHTQMSHFDAVFKREVGHDARDPKDSGDTTTLDAYVRFILLQTLVSVCINSMHKKFFQT